MRTKRGKSVLGVHVRRDDSYNLIRCGRKKIEVRLLKGIVCDIKVGDIVNIIHKGDKISIDIIDIKVFPSLDKMLQNSAIRAAALPDIEVNSCKDYYEQFYDKSQIDKYQAVALLFRVRI